MSVQASPSVKKMMSVFQIALGCDQKKASSQPAHSGAPLRLSAVVASKGKKELASKSGCAA